MEEVGDEGAPAIGAREYGEKIKRRTGGKNFPRLHAWYAMIRTDTTTWLYTLRVPYLLEDVLVRSY